MNEQIRFDGPEFKVWHEPELPFEGVFKEDIIVWYDGPQVYFVKDQTGQFFLVMCTDDEYNRLVVAASEDERKALLANKIDMHSFFKKQVSYLVDTQDQIAKRYEVAPDHLLPVPGVFATD